MHLALNVIYYLVQPLPINVISIWLSFSFYSDIIASAHIDELYVLLIQKCMSLLLCGRYRFSFLIAL